MLRQWFKFGIRHEIQHEIQHEIHHEIRGDTHQRFVAFSAVSPVFVFLGYRNHHDVVAESGSLFDVNVLFT